MPSRRTDPGSSGKKTVGTDAGKRQNLTSRWFSSWQPYAALVLIGGAIFARTIWFDYTYFDDDVLILKHHASGGTLSQFVQAFSQPYLFLYYRPVVTISLALDSSISNISPGMYHLSNVAFHLLACCLAFHFLVTLHLPKATAFLAGVVCAVHPLATQAIAWIPGRNDTLLAIFVLLALTFMVDSLTAGNWRAYGLHLLSFLLALLTKETALIFPLLCLSLLALFFRVPLFSRPTARYAVGWAAVVIAWSLMRKFAAVALDTGGGPNPFDTFLSNMPVLVELLGKLVVPVRLSAYPTFSTGSFIVGAAAAVLLLGLVVFVDRKQKRLIAVALLWIVLFILPGLFVSIDAAHRFTYLESRGYLSVIGFGLLLAAGLENRNNQAGVRRWMIVAALAAVYAVASLMYSTVYGNAIRHWKHAVEMSPAAADAHYNLGVVCLQAGNDTALAISSYQKAISLNPGNSEYHNNLGNVYGVRGRIDLAEAEFSKAIELDPADPYPYHNLGFLYYLRNNFKDAESRWKQAIALDPHYPDPQLHLVELYYREQNYDKALYYVNTLQQMGVAVKPDLLQKLRSLKK